MATPNQNGGAQKTQIKTPILNEKREQQPIMVPKPEMVTRKEVQPQEERAKFYTGHERLNLLNAQVQRVRELQEENDHLQREIAAKEKEVINCIDPLAILADIEHRKIIIARNTGEILKIYRNNDERLKRIQELENRNTKLHNDMMSMQGKFITTSDMEERTRCASEFFLMKSNIEKNIQEISDLNKN